MKIKHTKIFAISLFISGLLTGCGGGSSGGSGGSGSSTTSGTISGSYYEGAIVCLDANANGKCDVGETNTTSAADGSFTLTGPSSYDVVAHIPVGAKKHEVLNDPGTTVSTAVTFIAPREGTDSSGALIVSPISTKVREAMKANGETLSQAKVSVSNSISGINPSDLLENFNDTGLSTAKKTALKARIAAELTNIEASMSGSDINLTLLRAKITQDVVPSSNTATVNGLSMPNRIDAVNASGN